MSDFVSGDRVLFLGEPTGSTWPDWLTYGSEHRVEVAIYEGGLRPRLKLRDRAGEWLSDLFENLTQPLAGTGWKAGDIAVVDRPADGWPDWLSRGTVRRVESIDEWDGRHYLKLTGSPSKWRASAFVHEDTHAADSVEDEPLTNWNGDDIRQRRQSAAVPRIRDEVLQTAQSLISGDREQTYGSAGESFTRIATLWTALLGHPITATDVARCMVALKLSRLHGDPTHRDSWVDIAGYAALGAEIGEQQ